MTLLLLSVIAFQTMLIIGLASYARREFNRGIQCGARELMNALDKDENQLHAEEQEKLLPRPEQVN